MARRFALGLALAPILGLVTPLQLMAGSPLREGPPNRRGLVLEGSIGPSFCVGPGPGSGSCDPGISSRLRPGLAVSAAPSWRLNPFVSFGARYVRNTLGSGDSEGRRVFNDIGTQAALGFARVYAPFRRTDFSAEFGAGWSVQRFSVGEGTAGISRLSSSGLALRPALAVDFWPISDLSFGLEVAFLANLHNRFCADSTCDPRGRALPAEYLDLFVHGVTIGVRLAGVLSFSRW